VLSQIVPRERTDGDDPQAFRMSGVQRGLDKSSAETAAAKRFGNFRVNEFQRAVLALVVEDGCLPFHGQLEAIPRPIVDDVLQSDLRITDNTNLPGTPRRP
jgi:hypothetical protein